MSLENRDVCFGYSEADITPNAPVECVGFDRKDNVSRGILDKLIVQVQAVYPSLLSGG